MAGGWQTEREESLTRFGLALISSPSTSGAALLQLSSFRARRSSRIVFWEKSRRVFLVTKSAVTRTTRRPSTTRPFLRRLSCVYTTNICSGNRTLKFTKRMVKRCKDGYIGLFFAVAAGAWPWCVKNYIETKPSPFVRIFLIKFRLSARPSVHDSKSKLWEREKTQVKEKILRTNHSKNPDVFCCCCFFPQNKRRLPRDFSPASQIRCTRF